MNIITVSIKEKGNAVSRIVSGSYLVKFVNPDKEYPVNYSVKQDGTKVYKPQMLIGADLTENQIVELFSKQLL